VVSQFCNIYDIKLTAIINDELYSGIVQRETSQLRNLHVVTTTNIWKSLEDLLDDRGAVISVDLYELNHHYHDFHFIWLRRMSEKYSIFNPLDGSNRVVSEKQAKRICLSASEALNDITIVFMNRR